MDTITALATTKGVCAIHIIRLSGNDVYFIISKLARKKIKKEPNTIQHVQLFNENNQLIDDVLLMKFVAPKSFTGEDLIEINCHGNDLVVNKIIASLLHFGARLAEHGEFSKRALLNDKMNAVQLFAMNNFVHSSNDLAMKFSLQTMLNKQTKTLNDEEQKLFEIIGHMEVLIDYPEFVDDEKEQITPQYLINYINHMISVMQKLIQDAKIMIPVYKGINIAIVGVANAGKSSLLNRIVRSDKAIVSNIPGTTRDVVEAYINIDNNVWKLHDTAGIHETNDLIEQIGIKKSIQAIQEAQFVVFVIDSSNEQNYNQEKEIFDLIKDKPHCIVLNKSDLNQTRTQWEGIKISTLNDSYFEVIEYIKNELKQINNIHLNNEYTLQDERQLNLATELLSEFQNVYNSLNMGYSFDLIIDDMHRILTKFQELIGKTNDLNFIDRLFRNFCVGK